MKSENSCEITPKPSDHVNDVPNMEVKEGIPWWHPLRVSEFEDCVRISRLIGKPLRKIVKMRKAKLEFERKKIELDDPPKGHGDTNPEEIIHEEEIPEAMASLVNTVGSHEEILLRRNADHNTPGDDKNHKDSEES